MKNKKIIVISIIIIAIVALGFGIYKIYDSYLFNEDGTVVDGHKELIEHLKSIEDKEERKKQVDFSLEQNIITQNEANEIY